MLQQCFGRQNGGTASKNKLPQPIDLYYLFFSFFLNILRVVQIFFRKEPCTWSVSGSPKRSTTVALQMVNARGECFCQMSWSLRGDSLSPCMALMCVFFFVSFTCTKCFVPWPTFTLLVYAIVTSNPRICSLIQRQQC